MSEFNVQAETQRIRADIAALRQKGVDIDRERERKLGIERPINEPVAEAVTTPLDNEIIPARNKWTRKQKAAAVITAGFVGATGWLITSDSDNDSRASVAAIESSPSPTPSLMEKLAACEVGWEIKEVDHGDNNRWFPDGLAEIKTAQTPEEASLAALVWHNQVKRDPELLAGAYNIIVKPHENADADSLVENGCISQYGEQVAASLLTALSMIEITPDNAPATALNTGTDANGNVTVAERAGISGDRKAIKCHLADGRVVWILGRCGQPAVPAEEKVNLPVGLTDEKVPEELPGDDVQDERGDGGTRQQGTGADSDTEGYKTGEPKPTPSPASSPETQPTQSPQPIETTPANDGGGDPGGGDTEPPQD